MEQELRPAKRVFPQDAEPRTRHLFEEKPSRAPHIPPAKSAERMFPQHEDHLLPQDEPAHAPPLPFAQCVSWCGPRNAKSPPPRLHICAYISVPLFPPSPGTALHTLECACALL